jgi:hypothetical protein
MAQIERTTIQQRRVSEIFMKAVFRNAPAGALEIYQSVIAAGPKGNRSPLSLNRQALIQQTQAELLELNQQLDVLKICIEQDERMESH